MEWAFLSNIYRDRRNAYHILDVVEWIYLRRWASMQSWYHIIPKNTGLSTYVWIIFCLLPFFFIFRSSSMYEIAFGIFMTLLFFLSYRLSFISNSRMVYLWVSIEMAISLVMTFLFGYIYFALFLAFFIGNIKHLGGFCLFILSIWRRQLLL